MAEIITCSLCGQERPRHQPGRRQCAECYRELQRQRYQKNVERNRMLSRRWKQANPERHREQVRQWRQANAERSREQDRQRYQKNVERHRETARQWKQANRERVATKGIRRRYPGLNAGEIPIGWYGDQLQWQDGKCAGCSGKFTSAFKPTMDHIVPLKKGGDNDPTNLQLLCQPCNASKGARSEHEWRR